MLQKFQQHIQNEFSFLNDKKLLVAISGGIDSVVLTHLLVQLNCNVSLAHCNFKLRKEESEADELFVKNLAKSLDLQVFTKAFKTSAIATEQKKSIQLTARELRYDWFQELIENYTFNFVLTAHHADDNLETFIINLTRGTGLDGLTGIPKQNKNIVRPLLPFSRKEIKDYATQNKLTWREDKSNASTKYLRNKIRHKIAPVLKEINPSLLNSFSFTLKNLSESKQIIIDKIEDVKEVLVTEKIISKKRVLVIDVHKINNLSNPKAYLYQILNNYHFTEWNDILDLLNAQSGKQIFSKTHVLLKDRSELLLYKKEDFTNQQAVFYIEKNQFKTTAPIVLSIEKATTISATEKDTIYVDESLLSFPLQIRKWQTGDVFYPLGMQGKKKLSKYFKDEKMSLLEKENTWLLCTSKNEIVWIINKRQDRRFISPTNQTNYLKIKYN
jgi:tRNA(Ile)-lysidine synthase